jgi:hypothetical protein
MSAFPSWEIEGVYGTLLVATAVAAAYGLRHRNALRAGVMLLLPLVPAAARLVMVDSTFKLTDSAAGMQLALLGAASFLSVWAGVASGLLFDRLNASVAVYWEPAKDGDLRPKSSANDQSSRKMPQ